MSEFDWQNFDCVKCGACCQHYKTVDVSIRDENYQWLKENGYLKADTFYYHEDKSVSQKKVRKIMQMMTVGQKRCIALAGEIGKNAACSIYEHRPQACRNYEINTSRCRTARFIQITRELNVDPPRPVYNENVNRLINEVLGNL